MIRIDDNLDAFERRLSDAMREQLPFALSQALNDTATDVADAWRDHMRRRLDRPTPFTLRGPHVQRRASKRRLIAYVGIRPIQADYLDLQARGGVRTPQGSAILVPVGARLNRYGNMSRNYVQTLLSSGRAFVASRNDPRTAHLAPGIYRRARVSRGVRQAPQLMIAFVDDASYDRRLDFEREGRAQAARNFPRHLQRRLIAAWNTRR